MSLHFIHRRDANYQSSPLSSWTWILSCDLVQVYSQPSYMNLNCDIFSSTASIYQWSDRFLVLILDLHPEKSGWLGHRPFDYTGKKKRFSSPTDEFWLSICVTWRKKKNKILEHVSWRSLETQHYCIVDCNKINRVWTVIFPSFAYKLYSQIAYRQCADV